MQTLAGPLDPVELAAGNNLLVGRRPEPEVVAGAGEPEVLPVPFPSVSSNHVLVQCDDTRTRLTDLGSKNGTWVKLPPHRPVELPPADVELYLALPETVRAGDQLPEDASWTSADDFGGAVARTLEGWLADKGVPVRVSIARRRPGDDAGEQPGRIPLAMSTDLHVTPLRTMEARWPELLSLIWRYALRQNELFAIEQELRQEGVIVASPIMRRVYRSMVDAARRGMRVLIMGPSGAGKDALARFYHKHSGRGGAFVARNCAMMNEELLRAELFGAERGSFTGSVQRIIGAVERANGGTLFLDEIGELSADVQPMLLRFLDSGEYERLGQFGAPSHADVRIVCATNKDLRAACAKGDFRSDLWFRLSIQVIEVPPLRDRLEDVEAYLKTYSTGENTSAYDLLTPEAVELIRAHAWDGNFRELANFAARMPHDAPKGSVSAADCRRALEVGSLTPVRTPRPTARASGGETWSELAGRAVRAFREDHAEQLPLTWDDVKEYIEKYFKPLLFAQLSGAGDSLTSTDVRQHADRMAADRATAMKQLERYFDRFMR